MLNYIWLGLILAGIIAALSTDVFDLVTDKYRNDDPIEVILSFHGDTGPEPGKERRGDLTVRLGYLHAFYGLDPVDDREVTFPLKMTFSARDKAVVRIPVQEEFPGIWNEITRGQTTSDNSMVGQLRIVGNAGADRYNAELVPDPLRFVGMQRVTNEGIVGYASTAVTIAIGLIGIMTLWLGVMKVAEEAGLVQAIARGLRPVMTRLFPDVPANHPAMGAMILNISANMLGLANAATPLGLKAMEELNKLAKKTGTATDAMVTFLVINTSSVQLIPATVIAIRASVGSANPTEIIVPMILATSAATIAGITAAKLLQRLPVYRKQLD
jgi:spore maturation protein A